MRLGSEEHGPSLLECAVQCTIAHVTRQATTGRSWSASTGRKALRFSALVVVLSRERESILLYIVCLGYDVIELVKKRDLAEG